MWRCRGTMPRSCNPSRKSGTYEGERDNPQCDRCKSIGSRRFSDGCGYRRAFSRGPLSRFGRCRCARPDQGLAFSKQESSRNFERRHKKRRASFRVASGSDVRENRGRIIWACRSMLADMPSSIRDPGIKRFQSCSDLVAGRGLPAMRDASREFDR